MANMAASRRSTKSWTFGPCVMPAKAAYCRPMKTPECSMTITRKRACRSVNLNGMSILARSDVRSVSVGANIL